MIPPNFKGAAKRIEDADSPRIGARIGVGEDEFMPQSTWKRPAPRQSQKAWPTPRGKPGAYPKNSYPRLKAAMAIDETAAPKSASWGLGTSDNDATA